SSCSHCRLNQRSAPSHFASGSPEVLLDIVGGLSGAGVHSGFSICLWQYSQSPLIVDPSLAVCESSWQRVQPGIAMCPRFSGYVPQVTFIDGNTLRRYTSCSAAAPRATAC